VARLILWRGVLTHEQALKFQYTLGPNVHRNPYHIQVIRLQLTRNLGALYPILRDEIVTAFEEILDLKENEWKSVPALDVIRKVISRTSNRAFVGLPLCRNPDWIRLNIQFTFEAITGGVIIGLFPGFLAPLVARFMTTVPGSVRRAMEHLAPMIEQRQKCYEQYGDAWADKPNDLLSWLMDEAKGSERTVKSLTQRVLAVNFVALHTSSNNFTQALYHLAANPQYMQPLREEVDSILATEGWSKGGVAKMYKIDSFLKESQRMEGISSLNVARKVMKDFSFSDGRVIPKGTIIAVATKATHFDNDNYENADTFDPFRFANMREQEGGGANRHMIATNPEYMAFGHGKNACPGRFFASNELKSMLAHIVASYDVKLEDGASTRPESVWVGAVMAANPNAKVMFRMRAH